MKTRRIMVTKHFSQDLDDAVAELIIPEDYELPIDSVIAFGGEIIEKDGKKVGVKVTEAALVADQHYKNYLDAFPDSCTQSGGHIPTDDEHCLVCHTFIGRVTS